MPKRLRDNTITSPSMKNNETWNDCPVCGYAWKDDVATPGVIHRTKLCERCFRRKTKADDDYFKSGTRYPGQ